MLSNKVQAVLAILASVLLVAVVTLQVLELNTYSAAPTVWPLH